MPAETARLGSIQERKGVNVLIGQVVADALAQSWRSPVPPLRLSPEVLVEVSNILLPKGGAPLLWRRLRQSEPGNGIGVQLQQAYRHHTLLAAVHEREIVAVIKFLRSAGIHPLLAKGWSVARLYPEKGLRPYGDIDLLIRPEQYARASALMVRPEAPQCCVDLHRRFRELTDRTADQLFDRSRTVLLDGIQIQIMGLEDQLRHLCIHMLADGMWRPLWLCDVALIVESVTVGFDWDLCLAGTRTRSRWIICALGLAGALLKADIGAVPLRQDTALDLPRWLVPAVLCEWGKKEHYMRADPMSVRLGKPRTLFRGLQLRWPNPIQATVCTGGAFNEAPRLPFQVGECLRRGSLFVRELRRRSARGEGEGVGRGRKG
ncbi:MAG TPA: nucleotidyltransferase family protein [Acidobacteriota bacterium]|jgi:hypothetical protein